MFYWRGRFFSGLVCCGALWDNPADSFEKHVFGDAPFHVEINVGKVP